MTEDIKRAAVFEQFDNGEADVIEMYPDGSVDFGFGASNIRDQINAITAADVAPVVRCRDCKHSYEDLGGLYCSFGPCVDCPVSSDFWCANGKRRENAHAQD